MKLSIPVILGTARKDRSSEQVAEWVFRSLEARDDIEPVWVDVKEYSFTRTIAAEEEGHPGAQKWREIVKSADALLIVSPEYNHGYPGELKQLLDCAYDEYSKRPVGICGVSSGGFGGVRVVEALKLVCIEIGLIPLQDALYISRVRKAFNEDGEMVDEKRLEGLTALVDELVSMAEAFQSKRNR